MGLRYILKICQHFVYMDQTSCIAFFANKGLTAKGTLLINKF